MNVEDLTVKQIREISNLFLSSPHSKEPSDTPWEIGKNYFIRTVTHHHTGVLQQVTAQELVLGNACWIPDDGRFAQALESGEFAEVEPFPSGKKIIIGRASIIDAVQINTIPTSLK